MKKNTGEHAPVLRTAILVLSLVLSAGAMIFAGVQTNLLQNSVAEQTIQTKLSRDAVQAQTWQILTQQGSDISRIFLDHPNLRPYFYDGKPLDKTDPNFNAVMAVSEMYLDFIEGFQDDYVFALPGMAKDGESRLLWDKYFKDMFASSPALRTYAKEKQNWYSTDFAAYAPTENRQLKHIAASKTD